MIASKQTPDLSVEELRLTLYRNGYFPVLARGKISDVAGWRTPVSSAEEISSLTAANPTYRNTGILCGTVVAVDIDALDPDTAAALLAMAEEIPGAYKAPRRIGKAPKITLLFRASEARKKASTKAYRIHDLKNQVEVMGDGQQIIVFGEHPETGGAYQWIGPSPLDVPLAELPEITPEAIDGFVAEAEAYLSAHGTPIIPPRTTKPQAVYQPTEQQAPAGDGIWAELKAKAMANLGAWVPALGLSGTRTYDQGYLARADFRPSTSSTGKTGAKRGLSVCFSPDGICDYADGNRGYNPVDIVSVVLGISPSEAADWLRARVGDERPPVDHSRYAGLIGKMLSGNKHKQPETASHPVRELVAANDNKRQLPETPAMHPDPYNPAAAGGLIGDIARWITSTAVVKVSELSLASSIALMAGIFGSRALTPTKAGVNVFMTTIVRTAGGKGRPPSAIRALADKAVPGGVVSNSDPTSFAAFERILRKNSSVVAVMDEFGLTLQGVNSKKPDPAASSIRKFMLTIYDRANDVFDGKAYANADTKKDDSPIIGPALSVLSMTTAETLYKGLSQDSVSDGFLNRFLFVESSPHPDGVQPPDLSADNSPPVSIVHDLQKAVSSFPAKVEEPGKSAKAKHRVPFEGGLGSPAHEAWNAVFLWQHSQAWDDTESKIRGRAAENTIRLATLRAISRNPWRPFVTVEDVEWGWAIVFKSIGIMELGVKNMAGSDQEELRNAILEALRKAKGGTLYRSRLMRLAGIKHASTTDYTAAMTWLYMSGDVVDISEEGDGSKLMIASQDQED
ncbi:bifunctional DNA primase/polymerase [Sinorhizobium meliloti]|uniref:bifunctional DNA primase/polymerase n=1 Tax=Rhizobium meliloti TaxID=382 RepID=UPI000FE00CCD|nr:bifunctional DNA primase/polymerase [Sinorhizobium meliloti]RVO89860.1 DUF3987 domain-containing protein [Sinorhizobium meliloti]